MASKFISFDRDGEVATVRLNRPEVLNSFHRPMAEELQAVLVTIQQERALRAVLLTGQGRAFCCGQDLAQIDPRQHPGLDLGLIVKHNYNPIIRALRALEKPVVCLVNGVAAGAGANLALACDIVVASEKASFIQSFSQVGLVPDSGGTFFLPRLVGLSRATALCMLGDKVSAVQAQQIGMIYQVFAADKAFEEAMALTKRLSALPTKGLALMKRALNQSFGHHLEQQLDLEEDLQRQAGNTQDYHEGILAFLEKRPPQFRGS